MSGGTGVLPPEYEVVTWHELCLFLGGDVDSFTGLLLRLVQKADPGNRASLRASFPREVAAWEIWNRAEAVLSAIQLAVEVAKVLDPDRCPSCSTWITERNPARAGGQRCDSCVDERSL